MLHFYDVTVSHQLHGDTVHRVEAREPMLAAEAAERAALECVGRIGDCLEDFFAYKVEPARPTSGHC